MGGLSVGKNQIKVYWLKDGGHQCGQCIPYKFAELHDDIDVFKVLHRYLFYNCFNHPVYRLLHNQLCHPQSLQGRPLGQPDETL